MRKTKLLMAVCAILCSGWSLQTQAKDFSNPADYLTFTDFVFDDGATHYCLYNADAKMFFASGNDWNTRASIATFGYEIWFKTATEEGAPAGTYEIWDLCKHPNRTFNDPTNMFTDDGGSTWVDHASQANYTYTVTKVGDYYRIQNVAFAAKDGNAAKYLGWNNDPNDTRVYMLSASEGSIDWKFATWESYQNYIKMQELYATYQAMFPLLESIKDQDVYTDKGGALAKFEGILSTSNANVEAATTAAEIQDEIDAISNAAKEFIAAVDVKEGECFDLTGFIINPHFYMGSTLSPTGWDATFQNDKPGGGWAGACELRASIHNYEAYHKAFELSQTIANMPKGTYKVTLQGFVRHDNGNETDMTTLYCGIVSLPLKSIRDEYSTTSYFYDGITPMGDSNYDSQGAGGEGTYQPNGMTGAYYWFQEDNPKTGLPFYTNEVQTLVLNDGDLTIGFKCDSWNDWVLWDNFHLYYYGSDINITLDEATGSAFSEEFTATNLTLKKKVVEGYNTIILPFEVTRDQLGTNNVYVYEGDADGVLKFKSTRKLLANTPYLVKFDGESDVPFEFQNVDIVKAAESLATEGTEYDFVGTFGVTTGVAADDYVLGNGEFVKAKGGNKVKAFRAYIKKKAGEAEARTLKISIDGVSTAIDAIDGESTVSGAIYNLAGQQVKKAQKGLYIQNGKKMLVK